MHRKVALGTANLALGPAMTSAQTLRAIGVGLEVIDAEWTRGLDVVCLGEMGIGNTTAASAIVAAITGLAVADVIAGLVGVVLGAAARRIPVIVDGFIATAAALIATELCPATRGYLIAAHRSVEIGHRAALALPLLDAALALLDEMATFEEAGIASALPITTT